MGQFAVTDFRCSKSKKCVRDFLRDVIIYPCAFLYGSFEPPSKLSYGWVIISRVFFTVAPFTNMV